MSKQCVAISNGKPCRRKGELRIAAGAGMLACRATYSTGGGNGSSLSFNFRGANEGYVCARCGWHALGAVHGEGLTNRVPRYETILTDADAYLMHVETGISAAERAEMKAAKRKVVNDAAAYQFRTMETSIDARTGGRTALCPRLRRSRGGGGQWSVLRWPVRATSSECIVTNLQAPRGPY